MINHNGFGWTSCDPERLSQLEAVLRYQLPIRYRKWLLDVNGGFPSPSAFTVPEGRFSGDDTVTAMLGLINNKNYDISSHIHSQPWMLRENFFPIAFTSSSSYLGLEMKSQSESIIMIDICDKGNRDGLRSHIFISKDIYAFLNGLW